MMNMRSIFKISALILLVISVFVDLFISFSLAASAFRILQWFVTGTGLYDVGSALTNTALLVIPLMIMLGSAFANIVLFTRQRYVESIILSIISVLAPLVIFFYLVTSTYPGHT